MLGSSLIVSVSLYTSNATSALFRVCDITIPYEHGRVSSSVSRRLAVTWKRINVVPGVELHVRSDLTRPRPREMNEWLARLEAAPRKSF